MKFCRSCGEQMNDNQAICLKCGVQADDGNNFCPNCGAPVNPDAAICLNCGVELKKRASKSGNDLNGKDKTTMAIICFLLGGLGVHNFMMGESKKGIIKIVLSICCGIGGILALIDFIRILTDSYKYDPNAAF